MKVSKIFSTSLVIGLLILWLGPLGLLLIDGFTWLTFGHFLTSIPTEPVIRFFATFFWTLGGIVTIAIFSY